MTKPRDPDALLSTYLAVGMEVLPERVVDSVLDEVHRTRQRAVFGPWRTRSMFRTALGAAAVVAVVALGGALLITRPSQPAIGGPSPTPTMHPSESEQAVVGPNATPSITPTLFFWTRASLKEDWPAPIRAEPAGGAIVRPILLNVSRGDDGSIGSVGELGRFPDPSGDTGSAVLPWVDIEEAVICGPFCLGLTLVSNQPPIVDPTEQWIAYGVVVDDDGDGVPDRRFGIDNIPIAAAGEHQGHWQWMTDLHTGRTVAAAASSDSVGGIFLNTAYPPGHRADVDFSFGGAATGGGSIGDMPERFYGWASVIQDGRVVATDYVPDVGWLEPSPDAKP